MAEAGNTTRTDGSKRLDLLKLEGLIGDARDATIILDLLIQSLSTGRVKDGNNPGVIGGFKVYYLTEDQDRALYAASSNASVAAQALEEAFYADTKVA